MGGGGAYRHDPAIDLSWDYAQPTCACCLAGVLESEVGSDEQANFVLESCAASSTLFMCYAVVIEPLVEER